MSVGKELENSELIGLCLSSPDGLSMENAVCRLLAKANAGEAIDAEAKFVAKNFQALWPSIRNDLSVDFICFVLKIDCLKIESEDWLVRELINFTSSNIERLWIFETILFDAVSSDVMQRFLDFLVPVFDGIPFSLWERLCTRLTCQIRSPLAGRSYQSAVSCPFESNRPFDGIISYLAKKHGSNLSDLGIVKATASSAGSEEWAAKWCIDHYSTKGFCSAPTPGQWLQLDFTNLRVHVTHYSLLSRKDAGRNQHHPQSWVSEVSEDGASWTIVDTRTYDSHLNGANLTHTFNIDVPTWGQYFRLRQTDVNHRKDHYFTFVNLELFGHVNDSSK
jgi:hypothetical protein